MTRGGEIGELHQAQDIKLAQVRPDIFWCQSARHVCEESGDIKKPFWLILYTKTSTWFVGSSLLTLYTSKKAYKYLYLVLIFSSALIAGEHLDLFNPEYNVQTSG